MKFAVYLIVFLNIVLPTNAFAQADLFSRNVIIETSPSTPEPMSEIEVALNAYTINTTGAEITWFIDGAEFTEAKNERSFIYTTKEAGEETSIDAKVELRNGSVLNINKIIKPNRVDLIIEADTMVPSFYKGRSLPSIGSNFKAVAIPYTNGNQSAEDFTYLWKYDNQIQYGGPVKGKNVAEFTANQNKNQTVGVTVTNQNGEVVAQKNLLFKLAKPELYFYAENPLKGILTNTIKSPYIMTSEEVTFRAFPYFMDKNIMNKKALMEWEIDNKTVSNPNSDKQSITLRKENNGGSATVGFHIRNLEELVQGVKDSFTVSF